MKLKAFSRALLSLFGILSVASIAFGTRKPHLDWRLRLYGQDVVLDSYDTEQRSLKACLSGQDGTSALQLTPPHEWEESFGDTDCDVFVVFYDSSSGATAMTMHQVRDTWVWFI